MKPVKKRRSSLQSAEYPETVRSRVVAAHDSQMNREGRDESDSPIRPQYVNKDEDAYGLNLLAKVALKFGHDIGQLCKEKQCLLRAENDLSLCKHHLNKARQNMLRESSSREDQSEKTENNAAASLSVPPPDSPAGSSMLKRRVPSDQHASTMFRKREKTAKLSKLFPLSASPGKG